MILSTTGFGFAAAPPAPTGVAGGHLDWEYAAPGTQPPQITMSGGAVEPARGVLRFPVREGSYDRATGTGSVRYTGSVVISYPDATVALTEPVVVIEGSGASLRAKIGGRPAKLLDLQTFGAPPASDGDHVSWSDVPTALTSEGARRLDETADDGTVDLSLTIARVKPAAAAPSGTGSRSPSGTPSASTSPRPTNTPSPCVSPSSSPSGSPSATPSTSGTPNPLAAAATPSGTPSPSPSNSGCSTPRPPTSPTPSPSQSGASPKTGKNSKLPKTGDAMFMPLTLLGSLLVTAGGGALLAARRRSDD